MAPRTVQQKIRKIDSSIRWSKANFTMVGEAKGGCTVADVAQGEDESELGDDSTLHDLGAFGVFG